MATYNKDMAEQFLVWTKEGISPYMCASRFGVKRQTLEKWAQDPRKKEFNKAWVLGLEAFEAAREQKGWDIATGVCKGNAAVYIYLQKVSFGGKWLQDGHSNKLEITTKHENMSDEELNKLILRHVAKELPRISPKDINAEYNVVETENGPQETL